MSVDSAEVDPALPAIGERIEHADRVVAVDADVAREVVPGPERHDDERQIPLDRDGRNGRERAVASCHAEGVRVGLARDLDGIVFFPEHVDADTSSLRLVAKLLEGADRRRTAG